MAMKRQCAHDKICFIWTQGTFALQCQSPKKIFLPFRPQFGLRIGGHPPRPSPGSATAIGSILEFEKSPTVIQNSFSYPFCIFARKKKCHARHNTYQEPRSSSFGSWDSVFYCTNPSKSTTSSR